MPMDLAKFWLLFCFFAFSFHVAAACGTSKNGTCIQDIRALKNLIYAMKQRASPLKGWSSPVFVDPCGRSSCGDDVELECNYEGLTCRDWRVVKIMLDCPAHSKACSVSQRIDLPEDLAGLGALTYLSIANSYFSGTLPSWSSWPSLSYLNLSGNFFSGSLPHNWMGLTNLQQIDLSENDLTGKLPSTWASLANLRTLDLHHNALVGTVPPRWNELYLTKLDLRGNCGLCGSMMSFTNISNLNLEGTNLGSTCHAFNCNSQFFAHIMIIVSLVFGVLALCLLQRHLCMRCRNRRMRDRMAAGLTAQQGAPNNQDANSSASNALKLSQLAVVVMPDGQTVAFGRKLSSDNLEVPPAIPTDPKQPNNSTLSTATSHLHPSHALMRQPSSTTITITHNRDSNMSDQSSIEVSASLGNAYAGPLITHTAVRQHRTSNMAAWTWVRNRLRAARSVNTQPHQPTDSTQHFTMAGGPPLRDAACPDGSLQQSISLGTPVPNPTPSRHTSVLNMATCERMDVPGAALHSHGSSGLPTPIAYETHGREEMAVHNTNEARHIAEATGPQEVEFEDITQQLFTPRDDVILSQGGVQGAVMASAVRI